MKYIDMHCDTTLTLWEDRPENNLYANSTTCVDILRLRQGGAFVQFFAIFLLPQGAFEMLQRPHEVDDAFIESTINLVKVTAEKHADVFGMAYNASDIKRNEAEGKLSGMVTIEDGRSVTDIEKLQEYYQKGIRLISLLWNQENCLGYPNSRDFETMWKGLKPLGIEVVREMNRLGMIVDVSHLSDAGFSDVVRYSEKPFVASHSNSRSLSPHQRNLTDEQIKVLADKGGIAGLNFGPEFLNEDLTQKASTIALMVKHLNHMRDVGGIDVVALGTDFDGVQGELEISSAEKMPLLFEALRSNGWSETQVEKFAYRNALRVIEDVL